MGATLIARARPHLTVIAPDMIGQERWTSRAATTRSCAQAEQTSRPDVVLGHGARASSGTRSAAGSRLKFAYQFPGGWKASRW